jgi:hypothetical protein
MPFDGSIRVRTNPRAAARACAAIAVLDDLEQLMERGECWIKFEAHDLNGGYCLTGALDHLTPGWNRSPTSAGRYLVEALPLIYRGSVWPYRRNARVVLEAFNDSRPDYASIQSLIDQAKDLAQDAADRHSGRMQLKLAL